MCSHMYMYSFFLPLNILLIIIPPTGMLFVVSIYPSGVFVNPSFVYRNCKNTRYLEIII